MRVATSTVSDTIVRQIQLLSSQQSKLQNQVATGQRISQPEDDPAAVGRVAFNLETERRHVTQYANNTSKALSSKLRRLHFPDCKASRRIPIARASWAPLAPACWGLMR